MKCCINICSNMASLQPVLAKIFEVKIGGHIGSSAITHVFNKKYSFVQFIRNLN